MIQGAAMSNFLVRPARAWLSAAAWDRLVREHDTASALAEAGEPLGMARAQNTAMLVKFFLEQACGARKAEPLALRVLERDWGSFAAFEAQWRRLALDARVNWIVFGLSFLDFKFHLFPLQDEVPFCVSPVLCWCLRPDLVSGWDRAGFADALWDHTDWSVGELRLHCLEQPVDIFSGPQDCVAGACQADQAAGEVVPEPVAAK